MFTTAEQSLPWVRRTIDRGALGTRQTLEEMGRLAIAAAHDPEFISHARAVVQSLPNKAHRREADALFRHVKDTVRYVYDPFGLEVLSDPRHVLFVHGNEDCDGMATLVAALAMAVGHQAAFRTVAVDCDPRAGDEACPWSHVYALIGVPRGVDVEWLGADTTQAESYLGWEPQKRVTKVGTWIVTPPE